MSSLYAINYVAEIIGENIALIEVVSANSDNIDHGEMATIWTGPDQAITAFTDRGIESLKEFLADVRSWPGGMREFLVNEKCDPELIKRIMAREPR
ncbi:MAG: hypothetical protein O3C49_08170 [Proteobacteria bacterium]|nr:hypothetical protein [Pseudomonadota bacterium]